ncbi:MAG: hypothetical protein JWO09_1386 [Bacteroidetes bacterium]|nr:hypothetical protein [Bacteroidota bacterium]
MTKKAIKTIQEHSETRILLDSYDDIFSDFDPGEYAERTLSDDFIIQLKKIARNKNGDKPLLKLLLPAGKRNEQEEEIIVKRLHSYFKNVHKQLETEARKAKRTGWILTFIGIIVMVVASYISFMKPQKYYVHILLVLFEPGGWFLLWTGLDHLVYSSKEAKKDRSFYQRMIRSEIIFLAH